MYTLVMYASDRGSWLEKITGTKEDAKLRASALNWRIIYLVENY